MLLKLIKSNLTATFLNSPNFLQLLYVMKILWWGIGGLFGVRFFIFYLNYLIIFPTDILLILFGLMGFIGLLFNKYFLNILFAFLMVFVSSCVGITFVFHAIDTISAGTYFIDIFGTIWLTFRIQYIHSQQQKYLRFRGL